MAPSPRKASSKMRDSTQKDSSRISTLIGENKEGSEWKWFKQFELYKLYHRVLELSFSTITADDDLSDLGSSVDITLFIKSDLDDRGYECGEWELEDSDVGRINASIAFQDELLVSLSYDGSDDYVEKKTL
eukprot:CAMPEP_0170541328 /NCGR_PEP_ID=MMETSP0211-20121228/1085_1 /TAXON_ID=311385 /ORGANISM="Pseudokeronopsis sp., Strain OXSARD2" /LENGTH=130 /DNA_ID=CAMNT_0010844005 /DNA_START=13 /DNA_END=407 /DNA_ORIENTATION=-